MAAAAAACGSDSTGPQITPDGDGSSCGAAFMSITSGHDQLGRPGSSLGSPVVVQVTDADGNPLSSAGVCVSWAVLSGGGTVSGASATNASGSATGTWTLGPGEGVQTLEVRIGSSATRMATAVALDHVRPIVYLEQTGSGELHGPLFLIDEDGSNPTQLTTGRDRHPKWSPDGTRIAFVRNFHETCESIQGDLMVLDLAGYQLRRLTDDGACAIGREISWAPDGRSILMSRDGDLIQVDAATGDKSPLVTSGDEEIWPAWGPGGIAYSVDPEGDDDDNRAFLLTAPGGTPVEILAGGSDFNTVTWSRDGSRLLVFRKTPPRSDSWSLWTYDPNTEALTAVPGGQRGHDGGFSPDGTRLVASVQEGLPGGRCSEGTAADVVVVIDLATGTLTDLTPLCGRPSASPDWRPTG
jgi:hypothetical protein